ncbi:hypothetical protein ACPW96_21640 [Micromonospora sp. DT81.3]|uniref:hypothetical protein n=1 Tax=Micromonospora sp. DT81.3 TaxID=3416523 RepID=UPI003CF68E0C
MSRSSLEAPVRETVEAFMARKHNPKWRPAPLPKPTALPRMTDEQFEALYRSHMSEYGRAVDDADDVFATLPLRGGRPFRVGLKDTGRKVYPITTSPSGRYAVAKLRSLHHDVFHVPSGLQVPVVFSHAGHSYRIGSNVAGDGWKTRREAEQFMAALEAADIVDDDPNGLGRDTSKRDQLAAFLVSYATTAP